MKQRAMTGLGSVAALVILTAAVATPALGQERMVANEDWCRRSGDRDRGWFCEVREFTLAARDRIAVDAAPNGGISVQGWDRGEIRVRARVSARADTDGEAQQMVSEVEVLAEGREIHSSGPKRDSDNGWSVSYRISAPRRSNVALETTNGGISISELSGSIEFRTTNGGVSLRDLGGDVRGRTTNGGLDIELSGSAWQGEQLDVQTTNGGVELVVPEGYSAHLETGTVNGGLQFDFPITVQGRLDRNVSVDLGSGGSLIRARTTNGGVVVRRQ
jgi:hypothetical protein